MFSLRCLGYTGQFGCGFRVDCTPDYIATPGNEMLRVRAAVATYRYHGAKQRAV